MSAKRNLRTDAVLAYQPSDRFEPSPPAQAV
jgi:hypothetical protein